MFKFKGFWNPFSEEGKVGIMRNSIKSFGVNYVRIQTLTSKRKEMNKLVLKAYRTNTKITAWELIRLTIDRYPKFREFFDKELGFGDKFWKTQAEAAINNKGK